jgi:hypothetical protein
MYRRYLRRAPSSTRQWLDCFTSIRPSGYRYFHICLQQHTTHNNNKQTNKQQNKKEGYNFTEYHFYKIKAATTTNHPDISQLSIITSHSQ